MAAPHFVHNGFFVMRMPPRVFDVVEARNVMFEVPTGMDHLVFDLTDVPDMRESGLTFLSILARRNQLRGGSVQVCGLNDGLRHAFDERNMQESLNRICHTAREACAPLEE